MKNRKHVILFSLFAMNLVDQPAPEVKIDQGILSGKVSGDGSYLEYIGIPYATTNVESRLKAPLPPPKWDGVYKAVDEMYQCPQNTPIGVQGTEDCLKINVYVPAHAKGPLPVMVYIHGGAFIMGNGGKLIVGPGFLVKQDVILVSFNYRLGILGFLCLGTEDAPGNAGLKDQVAALRWIQRNIAAFGGDPDNVTIFGTSAGGASVSLLAASETTNGLFKRAIMHSGSSITSWSITSNPLLVASNYAKLLGFNTHEPEEIYNNFAKMSYEDLVSVTAPYAILWLVNQRLLQVPCVEKKIPGVEPFLTDLPYNLITKNPKNISLMYSSTDLEGLFFINEETKESLEMSNKKPIQVDNLKFNTEKEENDIDSKVREYYFGKQEISEKNIMNLSQLYTDLYFEVPAIMESEIYARKIDAPVYYYYFTYNGQRNFVKGSTKYHNETGACHGDDLLYIFDGTILPFRVNKRDQIVIDWIAKLLTNFAKYGDPTPDSAKDLPVKWIPHSKTKLNILEINDELKMTSVPNPKTYQFWKEIYDKYRSVKVDL